MIAPDLSEYVIAAASKVLKISLELFPGGASL
jgi:hypothetical protein